ncbi:MAG TPA: TIGR03435 family protein [Bryobacteraceae bacterium]|nr:TIGR03435 family protein [Bryobacteraceae bacterium]
MRRFSLFVVLSIFAVIASGQSAGGPQFDAVSIKPSAPDARGGGFNLSPGHLQAKNQNLRDLVEFAWDLKDYQVSGGPSWAESEHYGVLATFPAATSKGDRARMMQSMLAERFGLVVRQDSKEVSGYALVTGKNGPKLHSPGNEEPGMMLGRSRATGQRTLTATSQTMANLASILSDIMGRPVENRTSVEGKFDFSVAWTPDAVDGGTGATGGKVAAPPENSELGPTIFTALQETVGLKLESARVKVPVVVIEKAEKPSAN